MLNWDDYGKEEASTSAAVTATAPVVETPQVAKEQPAPVVYSSTNKRKYNQDRRRISCATGKRCYKKSR